MKRFVRWFAKLPFSGKFAVADAMSDVISSTNSRERRTSMRSCLLLLALFIVCHSAQVVMGFDVFVKGGIVITRLVGMIYSIANFCVVLVHIYLCWRILIFALKYRRRYRREGNGKFKKRFSEFDHGFSTIFTALAQIIFIIIYLSIK